MTAMKSILDLLIDANVLLVLAFCLWRGTQALIARSGLRHDYGRQLVLLKAVLFITIASPVVAHIGALVSMYWLPNTPLTVSDIAVAAYLRGDIDMPAVEFETLLNTRNRIMEAVLESRSPWVPAIFAALAAASAFFVARTVWSLWRVSRALDRSYLWRRTARADIRVSDTIGVPFAARGLFRRHVVLPSELMTHPRDLRLILAHEFQHLRTGDVEWELAFELLRPVFFWNPAFVLWKRSFDHLRELSCDQEVMASKGISPHDYARCLLEFCERRISGPWPKAMNVAFVRTGGHSARRAFESRIRAMYTAPKGNGGAMLRASVLVLTVGISLAAASVRNPGDWSQDRLMLSTVVNLERLEAINRGY